MKFTTSTILLAGAIAATATAEDVSYTKTYQLKVGSSTNTDIKGKFLATKEIAATTDNNPLGVWGTDRVARDPYQYKFTPSSQDSRFYTLKGALRISHLMTYGTDVAMGLYDILDGVNVTPKQGEVVLHDKFLALDGLLRVGSDFNVSGTPHGGAGSFRACKGDSVNDYQIYWYDGLSPLPIKNCEGISLEFVEAQASPSPTATGFLTGVTAPTATGTGGPFLTGVTAPTGTGNATSTAKPTQPAQGAGSKVAMGSGLMSLVLGALSFAL
ncbi:hypothetical protein BCR34DRAFT_618033 [Clohesyomyces aquaticus]|uniref:Uncharacterized protein n=1 Tax=Clohesyomyces aquaticus TaxID=1231657 RepID=A0A1Y1YYC7_9PLEO|nr:hypothetical protein BCR34DRAFT_618033 [Clohesyomyces aquaticus]